MSQHTVERDSENLNIRDVSNISGKRKLFFVLPRGKEKEIRVATQGQKWRSVVIRLISYTLFLISRSLGWLTFHLRVKTF